MSIEWGNREALDDTEVGRCENRDFGRSIALELIRNGKPSVFFIPRRQMQKLFDELCRYWFRPSEPNAE